MCGRLECGNGSLFLMQPERFAESVWWGIGLVEVMLRKSWSQIIYSKDRTIEATSMSHGNGRPFFDLIDNHVMVTYDN